MDIEQQLQNEQIKGLYQQSKTSLPGMLFLVGIIVYYFSSKVEQELLISWLITLVVIIVGRVVLTMRFNTIAKSDFNARKWAWFFTIGVALSALILSSTPVLFMDVSDPSSVIFLTLFMMGLYGASMSSLSLFLPAYYILAVILATPLIYVLIQSGEENFSLIAGYVALFLITNISFTMNMNVIQTRSIRQQIENRKLLEKLTDQTLIAEQANIDKSRFLAATSHDLRQPLHSLGLFLHVLKDKLSTAEQKQLMMQTEKSQQVLSQQLNSIIDITRIDAGELHVNKQPFQLKNFIDDVLDEFSLSSEKANCKVRTQITNDWTNTDKILLARIVRNFISNVIQHCPDSTLVIESRRHENKIELLFTDDGPGLADTDQEIIFSEFYQLNNPERDRNKGMGLGLSIVKRLTKLLNIKLMLQSEQGKGSTFSITLPLYISAPQTESTDSQHKVENNLDVAGLFVVVVDDEKENLDAMHALLTLWECEVLMAGSEDELMKEFRSADYPVPDMMLIDYRLREERTGVEVIAAVRRHFGKAIPAAIITGDTTINLESKLTLEDCTILYKPLATEDLQKLLNRKREH